MLWIAWISPKSLNLGFIKLGFGQANSYPNHDSKTCCGDHSIAHIPTYPFFNIYHTFDQTLEGLRCCEMLEPIQTYSILVVKYVGVCSRNWHRPLVKSQVAVVMVIHDGFKSQACTTIHHTYNETLDGLRCCELPESVQSHSILAFKFGFGLVNFNSNYDSQHTLFWPF